MEPFIALKEWVYAYGLNMNITLGVIYGIREVEIVSVNIVLRYYGDGKQIG